MGWVSGVCGCGGVLFWRVFEICCGAMIIVNFAGVHGFTVVMRMVVRWYQVICLVCNRIGDCVCLCLFGTALGCGV